MKILAIETSCDETAISILEIKIKGFSKSVRSSAFDILANVVASQIKVHAPWGGVVPNLAKREHQKNLPVVLRKALKQAKLSIGKPKIDLIAVTSGPGLEPALWVGINFAQELAKKWEKPLIGMNHLEGHIFSVFLEKAEFSISNFQFPVLALVVSGGHTELVLMKDWLKYKVIGRTLDDAAGEAFDKVAKMLKLGYPGGPVVAKEAEEFQDNKFQIKLPRPMFNSKDYSFSFSGLKTAVLYLLRDLEKKIPDLYDNKDLISSICAEFQQAVIDVLVKKTMRAAKEYKVKTIILGGGVAANKELRGQLKKAIEGVNFENHKSINFLMPEMEFTGDNAAMIALPAYFRWQKMKKPAITRAIEANGNLKIS